ncbi:MAG: ABC transporter permease [Verrucomicrobiia bacterium]
MINAPAILLTVHLGIKSLLLHKLRTALTMLGIIFGVCSVIAMLAIGEGASYAAQQRIKALGSNNIIINSVKPDEDSVVGSRGRSRVSEYGLTYSDAGRLQTTLSGLQYILPMRIIRESVRFNRFNVPSQIIGTHPSYKQITGLELVRGRFLTQNDEIHIDNVCAMTISLAGQLFPFQDPLDEEVRVGTGYYRVVGLVREKSSIDKRPGAGAADSGKALDNNLYIPLSCARSRFGETLFRRSAGSFEAERVQLHRIILQMVDTDAIEPAERDIEAMLRHFHGKKDYEIIVPLQLLREAEETKRTFNVVLGSIAAISLLVGGIGIMNIMLATVTERTREIGVRRALGARKKDIITQFLVETVVLSLGGGVIGVAVGVLVPLLVSHFAKMPTIVTLWSLALSFGISGLTGIIFGLYPASRAANLSPIEALRHE